MEERQKTNLRPVELRREGENALFIRWLDGTEHRIPSRTLRENCPCALCKETRGEILHQKPLSVPKQNAPKKKALRVIENSVEEEIRLLKVEAVGNYAVSLRWGDGHDDGIFTFPSLFELGAQS
jgi:DUF971 family protein